MTPQPWAGGPVRPGPVIADLPERLRPPRQITQIAGDDQVLFALCNDGTVWEFRGGSPWFPLPGIPQRQVAEGEL